MIQIATVLLAATLAQTQPPAVSRNFNDPKNDAKAVQGLRESTPPAERKAITPEMRGDIFMARKMYREAIDMYRQLPQDSPVTWNKIGIAYHQMVDLNTARRHYERAIKLNPEYAEAVNNLGTIYYAQKSYRKAVTYYRRALKITPNSASVLSNLGTAYFARKKYKEALEAYQQALAIDPEVFEHRNAAGVLLQERTVEERAKFHFYLAKTYAKAGNHERAIMYLRKALEEGFKEREKLTTEPDFAALQQLPEFQELMKFTPKVL